MAVVHRASATANNASTTSFTITKPAGTASGDVLVATINTSASAPTAPAGWTQQAVSFLGLFVFSKVAGGSEPASYVWTAGTNQSWSGGISTFSGADNTTPWDVLPAYTGTLSVSHPGVTTTTANAMVLGGDTSSAAGNITPPAGFTEWWESGATAHSEMAGAIQAAAGASGSKAWANPGGSVNDVWLGALKDAAPSATINSPTFIATTEQVFAPAVVPTLYVNPTFVPTGEQVFAPQVLSTGQIGPNFVTSEEQVFSPSVQVTSGPQAVTPNFVPTTAQVFAPAVVAARQVSPTFVTSAEQVFTPSLSLSGLAPSRLKIAHEPVVHVVVDHEPA